MLPDGVIGTQTFMPLIVTYGWSPVPGGCRLPPLLYASGVRLLLTRRWILFGVVVIAFAYLAYRLGWWQWHRLEARREFNAQTQQNLVAQVVPVSTVMKAGTEPTHADEWRVITATGTYDQSGTVQVRYQSRNGQLGVDIVTPLKLTDGNAVLIDRGWLETNSTGLDRADLPVPPAGQVTVTGWVRIDGTGSSTTVTDGSTRAISSVEIAKTLDYPVLTGFVDATSEQPPAAQPLAPANEPTFGDGPHFFYALQWWFFAILAIGGYIYLLIDEQRKQRSAGSQETTVDGDGGTGDE